MSGGDPGSGRRYAERAQFVPLPGGEVSALHVVPDEARAMLAFAHGAGAGIAHPYMSDMAQRLAGAGIATLRYHFPYMERRAREGGRRPPDRPPALTAAVRAAVARARRLADGLPLFAGGKSMGGRMTSSAAAEAPLDGVRGIVFFGFPLHPSGRPSTGRADHLAAVDVPTLFVQGTRDALADLELLRPIVAGLPGATLLEIEGADHGFHVLQRSGRTDEDVADEVARAVAGWMTGL